LIPVLQLIEFRHRDCGAVLLKMPLYEFLREIHEQSRAGEIGFEDLRVLVNGKELMPTECAHA
jgi:hypothetical protein